MMRGAPPLLVDWGPLNWLQFNAAHVTSDPTTNVSLNSYSWCWSKWKNWHALTFFLRLGVVSVRWRSKFSEHSYAPDHKELYYTCCHLKVTSFKRFKFIQWQVRAKEKSMVLGLYKRIQSFKLWWEISSRSTQSGTPESQNSNPLESSDSQQRLKVGITWEAFERCLGSPRDQMNQELWGVQSWHQVFWELP